MRRPPTAGNSRPLQEILEKEGTVEFKTDNRELFEFSLEEVKEQGWDGKAPLISIIRRR